MAKITQKCRDWAAIKEPRTLRGHIVNTSFSTTFQDSPIVQGLCQACKRQYSSNSILGKHRPKT